MTICTQQHPLFLRGITVDWQLEKIRAFVEITRTYGIAIADTSQLPVFEVGRCEKMDGVLLLPFDVEHHHPLLGGLVPDDFRIAIAAGDFFHHRVAMVFGKCSAVGAIGEALRRRVAGGGVKEHEWRLAVLAEPTGIFPIHDRTAAEHWTHVIRQQFIAQFLPVNEVFADRVAPMHVAPSPAIGVVLKEKMVLAIVKHAAVGVVIPAALRGKVKLPAKRFTVQAVRLLEHVALLHAAERRRILP